MNEPIETTATTPAPSHGRCLAEGCPCRDARVLHHRRAAFFAWLAAERGQRADRVIPPDAAWRLPSAEDAAA